MPREWDDNLWALEEADTRQQLGVLRGAVDESALYQATGDVSHLNRALSGAHWVLGNRAYYDGGFRHARGDAAGPYLSDTLYMGRAFLVLYQATGDPRWLDRSTQAAGFIDRYFRYTVAGLVSAKDNGTPIEPLPQIDQNISAALFLLELTNHAEDPAMPMDLARHTLRLLVTEEIALSRPTDAGILLDSERLAALTGESKRLSEGQPDRAL